MPKKEYIERDYVLRSLVSMDYPWTSVDDTYKVVQDAPAADVVEVVHGSWVDKPTGAYCRWQSWCSACGKHSGIGGIESNRHKPYCPNCGAKMDGGKEWT